MKQLHPKCLTQGQEQHHNFLDGWQVRFLWFSSLHFTYPPLGSYLALLLATQWDHLTCSNCHFLTTWEL